MVFNTGSLSFKFNLQDFYAGLKVAGVAAVATFLSVFLKMIPQMHFANQLEPAILTALLTWLLQFFGSNQTVSGQ